MDTHLRFLLESEKCSRYVLTLAGLCRMLSLIALEQSSTDPFVADQFGQSGANAAIV